MRKKKSLLIKSIVILINLIFIIILIWLFFSGQIIFELFLALVFLQSLVDSFLLYRYLIYKKAQKLAEDMDFQFITIYMEQPRLEGIYKDNWWQIHFASRPYGEYWGIPRTYIKLQYRNKRKFDDKVLKKYEERNFKGQTINSVEHIRRPYKDYLLMKVKWYIFDKKKLYYLMNFLLKIAKESEMK